MAWSLDTSKVASLSEGSTKLPIGTNPFRIVSAGQAPDKQDPTGKSMQVVIGLQRGDKTYKVYLAVESKDKTRCEIALKTLRDFCVASGVEGIVKPEKLKKLVDNVVVVEVYETHGKGENASKVYANIGGVEAYTGETEEEEEAEPEEEEEAPKPAPKPKGKTKPTPAPEPEEEEEEEEETEEEEEEEEAPAPTTGKKKPWEV